MICNNLTYFHIHRCKDRHIYCSHMLLFDHIQSLECILVDSHCMGRQSNLGDKSTSQLHYVLCILHLSRMGLDYKDLLVVLLVVLLE